MGALCWFLWQRLQHVDHYQSMCRRLFCAVPWDPTAFQAIFAMEKTTCGDGKVGNSSWALGLVAVLWNVIL